MQGSWQPANFLAATLCKLPRTDTAMRPALQQARNDLPLGAHLVTVRDGYSHHGIYVGGGKVVHYAGLCTTLHRGPVEEVALERFAAGRDILVVQDPQRRYSCIEAVQRARSRLGENRYSLLTNNCEHFCTWCIEGVARSEQVRACFTHPLAAVRALTGLYRAFIAARGRRACRPASALLAA
jgi:hypothetical protein